MMPLSMNYISNIFHDYYRHIFCQLSEISPSPLYGMSQPSSACHVTRHTNRVLWILIIEVCIGLTLSLSAR